MNDMFGNAPDLKDAINRAAAGDGRKHSITLDVEKYQAMLDDPNMTEGQSRELIETVWSMVVNFVDLDYGVHPDQEACGQLLIGLDEDDIVCLDALELSPDTNTKRHESADADPDDPPASGRIP